MLQCQLEAKNDSFNMCDHIKEIKVIIPLEMSDKCKNG
jgi:hypothetical protein